MMVDIHGHSLKQGVFMFGCIPDKKIMRPAPPIIAIEQSQLPQQVINDLLQVTASTASTAISVASISSKSQPQNHHTRSLRPTAAEAGQQSSGAATPRAGNHSNASIVNGTPLSPILVSPEKGHTNSEPSSAPSPDAFSRGAVSSKLGGIHGGSSSISTAVGAGGVGATAITFTGVGVGAGASPVDPNHREKYGASVLQVSLRDLVSVSCVYVDTVSLAH